MLPEYEKTATRIGLKPWEFRRMTPAEFLRHVEGWAWRDEQAWRKTAWQTAHALNIWLKPEERVTVDDLLQQEKPKEEQTPEQQAEIMAQWVAVLGGTDRRVRNG